MSGGGTMQPEFPPHWVDSDSSMDTKGMDEIENLRSRANELEKQKIMKYQWTVTNELYQRYEEKMRKLKEDLRKRELDMLELGTRKELELKDLRVEMDNCKSRHQGELMKQRKEMEVQNESVLEELRKKMEVQHESELDELQSEMEAQREKLLWKIQKLTRESELEGLRKKMTMRVQRESELEDLRKKMEVQHESELEEQRKKMEVQRESELEDLRKKMEVQRESELEDLRKKMEVQHESELEEQRKKMEVQRESELEDLRKKMEVQHESELEEQRKKMGVQHERDLEKLQIELLEELKTQCEGGLRKMQKVMHESELELEELWKKRESICESKLQELLAMRGLEKEKGRPKDNVLPLVTLRKEKEAEGTKGLKSQQKRKAGEKSSQRIKIMRTTEDKEIQRQKELKQKRK